MNSNTAAALTTTTTTSAKALPALTAARLFTAAVSRIESESIRSWAKGQRAVWLKIAAGWLRNHGAAYSAEDAILRFSTYITLTALG